MLNKMVISFLLKNKGKIASIILTFVGGCVFLILLIPTVLFSGGQGSDFIEKDGYEKAWEANACSKETKVILQDIRAMEAYVDPDSFENISKEEALKSMPAIDLQLNDKSSYSEQGQIESISGIIDRSTGTVSLRAVFPNKEGLLHSGGEM